MRAAIFIDGGYILQQLKVARVSPNYADLANYLLTPLRKSIPIDLLRCYFYYCAPWMSPSPSEDELRRMEQHKQFVEEIERQSRWQVRLGKLEKRRDGTKEYFEQKRVDVLLSVDLVRHAAAGHIQHAILVAGDSDFIPAVAAAKESGVTLTLWCGQQNTVHKDLVTLADEVHHFHWRAFPKAAVKQSEARQPLEPSGRATSEQQRRPERPPRSPDKPHQTAEGTPLLLLSSNGESLGTTVSETAAPKFVAVNTKPWPRPPLQAVPTPHQLQRQSKEGVSTASSASSRRGRRGGRGRRKANGTIDSPSGETIVPAQVVSEPLTEATPAAKKSATRRGRRGGRGRGKKTSTEAPETASASLPTPSEEE